MSNANLETCHRAYLYLLRHRSGRTQHPTKRKPLHNRAKFLSMGSMHSKRRRKLFSSLGALAHALSNRRAGRKQKMKNEYLAGVQCVCAVPNHLLKYTSALRRAAINRTYKGQCTYIYIFYARRAWTAAQNVTRPYINL